MRIQRFSAFEEFERFVSETRRYRETVESWLSEQEVYWGFCDRCWAVNPMAVDTGVRFGERPNLREGLRCTCGLTSRQRLMYSAVRSLAASQEVRDGCLLEQASPLFDYLSQSIPNLQGSEFLGPDFAPASEHRRRGRVIRHENFCDLSYASDSLDLLAHNDVLEHVPDFKGALGEAFRVLKPGAAMVFTCPLFAMRKTVVRARFDSLGELENLEPPELHGDGLRPEGILAYYNYGWELIEEIRLAGFGTVEVCVDYDVFRGLTSCNYPEAVGLDGVAGAGNMLPLYVEARKAC